MFTDASQLTKANKVDLKVTLADSDSALLYTASVPNTAWLYTLHSVTLTLRTTLRCWSGGFKQTSTKTCVNAPISTEYPVAVSAWNFGRPFNQLRILSRGRFQASLL